MFAATRTRTQPPSSLNWTAEHKDVLDPDFLYGFATAALQVEGAADRDGRGQTAWDVIMKRKKIDLSACNAYDMVEEDVALLKSLGAKAYRFSIAWSRIIPLGGRDDPVEPRGIEHYSKLIDTLLAAGIKPIVTLFHWDLPLALAERYGGFRARERRAELYADWDRYVRVCFGAFGDRVKHWVTHNEPAVFALVHQILYPDFKLEERWNVGRNLIMTHARAVDIYRREFRHQSGTIGIALQAEWIEPIDDSLAARQMAQLGLDLSVGWFADPIFLGRPNAAVESIAPDAYGFANDEWELIRGSADFFGLNHYSTHLATGRVQAAPPRFLDPMFGCIEKTQEPGGVPLGLRGHGGHPYIVPWGFERLLKYIDATWTSAAVSVSGNIVPIYVLENGYAEQDERQLPFHKRINDANRVQYFEEYLAAMARAVSDGVCVKGYMAWSLFDNLEWTFAYDPCFGVVHVDREGGSYKRTPKNSALVLKRFFREAVAAQPSRL